MKLWKSSKAKSASKNEGYKNNRARVYVAFNLVNDVVNNPRNSNQPKESKEKFTPGAGKL